MSVYVYLRFNTHAKLQYSLEIWPTESFEQTLEKNNKMFKFWTSNKQNASSLNKLVVKGYSEYSLISTPPYPLP